MSDDTEPIGMDTQARHQALIDTLGELRTLLYDMALQLQIAADGIGEQLGGNPEGLDVEVHEGVTPDDDA